MGVDLIAGILLAAAGLLAGVSAGLLGIGGGLILVPAVSWILQRQGVDLGLAVTMAVATALATIVFTAASSVWAHQRRGAVRWSVVGVMVLWVAAGAVLGGIAGDYLGGRWLAGFFALFALLVAMRMWRGARIQVRPARPLWWPRTVAAAVGGLSAMAGIGGGSMTVPYLVWRGVPMAQAVATGSALGYPIALAGAATYIALGWRQPIAVPHWGYLYWPGFLLITAVSMISAPWGAALAHRWPARRVAQIFALLLVVVALRMGYSAFV